MNSANSPFVLHHINERSDIARRGMLLVVSSPSGAGKTTLTRRLLAIEPGIRLSISATTRKPRPGEVDGEHYFFIDEAEFRRMIAASEFLEYAQVFGNLYGTPRAPVENWLRQGMDVLFDVDWQGAQQLRQAMPQDVVSVFILPPNLAALESRLNSRNQDPPDVVAARMAKAIAEISHWPEYDYVLVNENLTESHVRLEAILAAERARRHRLPGLVGFVRDKMVSKA